MTPQSAKSLLVIHVNHPNQRVVKVPVFILWQYCQGGKPLVFLHGSPLISKNVWRGTCLECSKLCVIAGLLTV